MLLLFLFVLALSRPIFAAADDNTAYNPYGAVAFIRTGERSPLVASGTPMLSNLGAHQMHTLGQQFRGRYIGGANAASGIGQNPIKGMYENVYSPDQILVQTLDTPYLVAAAQAFMQGLYPPFSGNDTSDGLGMGVSNVLANGSELEAPLGGYQYTQIESLSGLDARSIYIAGDENCPMSIQDSLLYQTTAEFSETRASSREFYRGLNESLFNGLLTRKEIDYVNALLISDYLTYANMHDRAIHEQLGAAGNILNESRFLADTAAWYLWGNATSPSSAINDDSIPVPLRAIPGQTLAAGILSTFQQLIASSGNITNGNSSALTLLFGEYEPLISLASLLQLDAINENFKSLPPFASTVIFELFSIGNNDAFPDDVDKLWVNFYWINGTEEYTGFLRTYPMFGSPIGTEMPWRDFETAMKSIMMSELEDWCGTCKSGALFCWGAINQAVVTNSDSSDSSGNTSAISPAVGGVIGAVTSLAVAGIVFALAVFFGGVRFHRVPRAWERKSDSSLGGFKGAAKLASDADLTLAKNAAVPAGVSFDATAQQGHERAGSWELRAKEKDTGLPSYRTSRMDADVEFAKPVEPFERV